MRKMLFGSLVLFVVLFSVTSAFGQSRVVLDQSTNAVAFSPDSKSWGLQVNGMEIIEPGFKTVGFQNGLFKLEDWQGNWMVIDAEGNNKLSDWTKASDVKISESFVVLEKVAGGKDIIYDRATWKLVTAKETTYDDMFKEVEAANASKGTKIHGYEPNYEIYSRLLKTVPHYIPTKTSGGKSFIKRDGKEIVSWTGTGKWLDPNEGLFGDPSGKFPKLGKYPYRNEPQELYFLAHKSEENCAYVIWVLADGSDKYYTMINGKKRGYVKITPHQQYLTRLMMCQTADGVEHPIWVWGQPLINAIVPNESWTDGESTKKREEIAKPHVNCPHCIEQSKIYNER